MTECEAVSLHPKGCTCIQTEWADVVTFNDIHFPDWRSTSLFNLSNAMIGEFGEYANSLKHMFGGGTNQTKVDNVQPTQLLEELADMWIYLVLTVENLGFDELQFNSAISRKVKRLYERMNERKHEDKMR